MEQLRNTLGEVLNGRLMRIIISSPRKGTEVKKIEIRPFEQKEGILFQFSSYRNNQVFHSNYDAVSACEQIAAYMEKAYRQMEIWHDKKVIHVLISKKGTVTIKEKKNAAGVKIDLSHNRKRNLSCRREKLYRFLLSLECRRQMEKLWIRNIKNSGR